jgi:hypothetical protein
MCILYWLVPAQYNMWMLIWLCEWLILAGIQGAGLGTIAASRN